jgi:hypothetical protein
MAIEVNIADWIVTEDGIGQVLSYHNCYVEKYSPSFLRGEKKIGVLDHVICQYKLFMDFEGKIRKRNAILTSNANYCEKLSDKYQKLLNEVIEQNSEAYKKFQSYKAKNSQKINFELFFHNERGVDLDSMKESVKGINASLNKPFVFDDFIKLVDNQGLAIDFAKANKNPNLNIPDYYIRLHNENYGSKDKKLLFNKVELIVNRQ